MEPALLKDAELFTDCLIVVMTIPPPSVSSVLIEDEL